MKMHMFNHEGSDTFKNNGLSMNAPMETSHLSNQAIAAEQSSIGFTEFGRIAADFKLMKPVYFREAKIAVLERNVACFFEQCFPIGSLHHGFDILSFFNNGRIPPYTLR